MCGEGKFQSYHLKITDNHLKAHVFHHEKASKSLKCGFEFIFYLNYVEKLGVD